MGQRLTRKSEGSVLGGVAAGFGAYFDLDPLLIRLAFILLTPVGGAGAIAYAVAWAVMPVEGQRAGSRGNAPDGAPGTGPEPSGTRPSPPPGVPPGSHAGATAAEGTASPAGVSAAEGAASAAEATFDDEGGAAADPRPPGDRLVDEARAAGERVVHDLRSPHSEGSGRGRIIAGLILVALGLILLVDQFFPLYWLSLGRLWPLILIIVGIGILARSREEDRA